MSKTRQVLGKVLITFEGEFNSSTQYEQLDIVTYEGSTYIAKQDTQGNLPTNITYFALLVQKPIKGTDYFTQEEIDNIVDEVIEDATNEFNRNVVTKTNEFNTNATNKTDTFNSNATSKISDFNSNYDSKLSSFDSHVSDKKDELDTYEESKETEFDSHVSDKIDEFDSNATDKTTAFNTNASEKINDFNNNAEYIENELDKYKTIYNVLPKLENETISSEVELDGTGEAYIKMKLYGKVSQESTSISGGDEYDSPSPDHPQPIRYVTGDNNVKIENKNLAWYGWAEDFVNRIKDKTRAELERFDNKNVLSFLADAGYNNYDTKYMFKISFKENTQYTMSFDLYVDSGQTNIAIAYTDGTSTYLGTKTSNVWHHITFTSPVNKTIKYIRANYSSGKSRINLDTFMVEENLTATQYTPHKEQNLSLNIGNYEMYEGDYFFKNTIDSEDYDSNLDLNAWYLKNSWGKVVLDGSENWNEYSSHTVDGFRAYTSDKKIGKNPYLSYDNIFCDYFKPTIYTTKNSINVSIYATYLNIDNTIVNTVSDLTTWLSTHNTTVVYPLVTPTYKKVTDTTLISQLEASDSANSYKEKTYITCTSASADNEVLQVKAVALKDIQAMFDETNNAILEIGGE